MLPYCDYVELKSNFEIEAKLEGEYRTREVIVYDSLSAMSTTHKSITL